MEQGLHDLLIDQIYEAGALPELWPQLLGQLSKIPNGVGGLLFVANNLSGSGWIASDFLRPIFQAFIDTGWAARNTRPQRLGALKHSGFVGDLDAYTREELDQEPVYAQFYRPRGLGWATGTMFCLPNGDNIVFSFERPHDRGPVEREKMHQLDVFRPHLGRAALLSWRLGLQRAQAMTQALEIIGLPSAVLRRGGRLLAGNALLQALIPDSIQDRRERLFLADAAADGLFLKALNSLEYSVGANDVRSFPIVATKGRARMIAHLLPIRRAAHDIFTQAESILVITPVDRANVPEAEILEALFDLTPAEARVARGVGQAQAVDAISKNLGVSRETVRTHLKAVLSKTGLNRQIELANLLAGATLPRAET